MKAPSPIAKLHVEPRTEHQTPAELVQEIMGVIYQQFYASTGAKPEHIAHSWGRDRRYIQREVVLWPARWLRGLGLRLSASKYKRLLLDKLVDLKRHCQQDKFNYLPAYLATCIQTHFQKHYDEIYEECKRVQQPLAAALSGLKAGEPDVVEALSAAQDVLTVRKHAKKPAPLTVGKAQGELF